MLKLLFPFNVEPYSEKALCLCVAGLICGDCFVLIPYLSFFWCLRKPVLCDCVISWVSSLISLIFFRRVAKRKTQNLSQTLVEKWLKVFQMYPVPFMPVMMAEVDASPTGDQEVTGSIPAGSETFFRGD